MQQWAAFDFMDSRRTAPVGMTLAFILSSKTMKLVNFLHHEITLKLPINETVFGIF